jgi:hypothetical protein
MIPHPVRLALDGGKTFSDGEIVFYCQSGVNKPEVESWSGSKNVANLPEAIQRLEGALGDLDRHIIVRTFVGAIVSLSPTVPYGRQSEPITLPTPFATWK